MRPRLTDTERRTFALRNAATWRDIREAAEDAFDASRAYRYFDGTMTHDCDDMHDLARVTRDDFRASRADDATLPMREGR